MDISRKQSVVFRGISQTKSTEQTANEMHRKRKLGTGGIFYNKTGKEAVRRTENEQKTTYRRIQSRYGKAKEKFLLDLLTNSSFGSLRMLR